MTSIWNILFIWRSTYQFQDILIKHIETIYMKGLGSARNLYILSKNTLWTNSLVTELLSYPGVNKALSRE